jgi:hypothetical protein
MAVAQSNRSKRGSFVAERLLMFAQLRGVLAAKDSSIVAQKDQHGRLFGPQRAKTNLPAIAIGKRYFCELAAQRFSHDPFMLKSPYRTVKPTVSTLYRGIPATSRHFHKNPRKVGHTSISDCAQGRIFLRR